MLKARDIGERHSFEIDLHILMQQQHDYVFIFYLNHWCPFFHCRTQSNFGVKDTEACLCEEAIFSATSEERDRQYKASKLHNSMFLFYFFTKTKIMFVFVDGESQRQRRASFFWDWCKLFLENKCFCCLLPVYVTFWCNNSVITCSYFI